MLLNDCWIIVLTFALHLLQIAMHINEPNITYGMVPYIVTFAACSFVFSYYIHAIYVKSVFKGIVVENIVFTLVIVFMGFQISFAMRLTIFAICLSLIIKYLPTTDFISNSRLKCIAIVCVLFIFSLNVDNIIYELISYIQPGYILNFDSFIALKGFLAFDKGVLSNAILYSIVANTIFLTPIGSIILEGFSSLKFSEKKA